VQYHGIKGNDLEQFKGMKVQTILAPKKFETGKMIYPYDKAK
jgi:branched-chain amino acid transport system substrate-binding protein